jgi:hypothetical protein
VVLRGSIGTGGGDRKGSDRRLLVEQVIVEQIELAVIRSGRHGLIVTPNLIEVISLELQGELHEHLGDASGRFV